jgi:hypothetical protein
VRAQKETLGLNRGTAAPTRVDDKPTLAEQGPTCTNKIGAVRVKTDRLIFASFKAGDGAFTVFIGRMEKTIALSFVVAIVVFAAIYAVTVLKFKPTRR